MKPMSAHNQFHRRGEEADLGSFQWSLNLKTCLQGVRAQQVSKAEAKEEVGPDQEEDTGHQLIQVQQLSQGLMQVRDHHYLVKDLLPITTTYHCISWSQF